MAISVTYHGGLARTGVQAVSGQNGNAIAVADDAVSAALTQTGLYRIAATSDCTIRIGYSLTDASDGEYWPTNCLEIRWIETGKVIAVDALA